jgi:deazaflavin-dependent oxidoreductase (nitroreductase family)
LSCSAFEPIKLIAAGTRESRQNGALVPRLAQPYIRDMNVEEGSTVVANLTTTGRKTGLPRTVELGFAYFNGNFYASSSKVKGKHWCLNMIRHPAVEITVKGEKIACMAKQVAADALRRQILTLRDAPPQMDRVVFEISPRA